ncbi:elongation factor P [Halarsenatibacter silvermanii]|uniref:Elongation factor P n=1 Tax=Halarsenatibacter silvermanii TaxID=321763 RepID=A0A1G9JYE0_9FIRM|nr:elongation factor P [Halarsenatibacter silvermanii]SDL42528.1 translation elongation factor P (EF-P) [Halarsenatibacter silvermanii]
MISTNDFTTGLTIELEDDIYTVENFEHSKSGRGGAFVRTRLKSLTDGHVINKTFRAGEKVEQARIDKRKMKYLYQDEDRHIFMDIDNYEQTHFMTEDIKDELKFLKENSEVQVLFHEDRPIKINLPTTVALEVVEAPPAVKGDTVSGGTKEVKVETGYKLKVPLFIEKGTEIVIDTRTGEYQERA